MLAKSPGIICGYPVTDTPTIYEMLDKTKKISTENVCVVNSQIVNNTNDLMLYLTLIISVITLIIVVMVLIETYKLRSLEKKDERRD